MRKAKAATKLLVVIVLALLLGAAVLYLTASSIPSGYAPNPGRLGHQARKRVAQDQFTPHILVFGNRAQKNEPFTWSASQDQLNNYLAAADEIAAIQPRRKRTRVHELMDKAGLADPFVALDDGVLTLMVRLKAYNKIVSADLSFSFTPAKELRVRLGGTRIGLLPIPDSVVRGRLKRLQRMLRARVARRRPAPEPGAAAGKRASGGDGPAEMSADVVGGLLGAVIAAIDEEPISAELTWPVNRKSVRIEGIDIDDGLLTLHVVPIRRATGQSSAARRNDHSAESVRLR